MHGQTAPAADSSADPVNEVVVTGYRPGDATVASKTGISALENVQAISVSQDLLQEQGFTRLADALRNVAGVSRSSTYGFFDAYQIRGYDAAYGSVFLGSWTAQFNFNNLLDERHFPDGAGLDRITPGEPRNWQLTLSTSFF